MAVIYINNEAIRSNIRKLKERYPLLTLVVKNDAYGMGLERVVTLAQSEGVNSFGTYTTQQYNDVVQLKGEAYPIASVSGHIENLRLGQAQLFLDGGLHRGGFPVTTASLKGLAMLLQGKPEDTELSLHSPTKTLVNLVHSHYPNSTLSIGGTKVCESYSTFPTYARARMGNAVYGLHQGYDQALVVKASIATSKVLGQNSMVGYNQSFVPQGTRIATVNIGHTDGYIKHENWHWLTMLVNGVECRVLDIMANHTIIELPSSITTMPHRVTVTGPDHRLDMLGARLGVEPYTLQAPLLAMGSPPITSN